MSIIEIRTTVIIKLLLIHVHVIIETLKSLKILPHSYCCMYAVICIQVSILTMNIKIQCRVPNTGFISSDECIVTTVR